MSFGFPTLWPGYARGVALELHLQALPSAAATARQVIATWLRALHVSDIEAEEALIVVSELVTEGVSHQGGDDIVVRARVLEDRRLVIEVVSTPWPKGVTVLHKQLDDDPESTQHRMEVVAAMSDDVVVQEDDAGHRVVTVTLKVA
jgi:anti-sigma regulatory factor (Ser/Thr protein kinase)